MLDDRLTSSGYSNSSYPQSGFRPHLPTAVKPAKQRNVHCRGGTEYSRGRKETYSSSPEVHSSDVLYPSHSVSQDEQAFFSGGGSEGQGVHIISPHPPMVPFGKGNSHTASTPQSVSEDLQLRSEGPYNTSQKETLVSFENGADESSCSSRALRSTTSSLSTSSQITTYHRIGFAGEHWSLVLQKDWDAFWMALVLEVTALLSEPNLSVQLRSCDCKPEEGVVVEFFLTRKTPDPLEYGNHSQHNQGTSSASTSAFRSASRSGSSLSKELTEAEIDAFLSSQSFERVWKLYGDALKLQGATLVPKRQKSHFLPPLHST